MTIFNYHDGKIFVKCGCFEGSFGDFVKRVRRTYDKDNPYRKEYEEAIKKVKGLWGAKIKEEVKK